MSMTLSLPTSDTRRRPSLPHSSLGDGSASKPISGPYLSNHERAAIIAASSTRRPSVHQFFSTSPSSSTPSVTSSCSSASSAASSPGGLGASSGPNSFISPILTPFQWTSDLRQYIMTDIGPQPSNSRMPTLRSHSHLVRQVSCSKISPAAGGSNNSPSGTASASEPSSTTTTTTGGYNRYSTITDLCTIPQDEILPPMDVPLEKRFAHDEWDDEDE